MAEAVIGKSSRRSTTTYEKATYFRATDSSKTINEFEE